MNCEIIAIGSEMLTPHRQDTNSLYLTSRLNELGVSVAFKTIVGDKRQHLVDAARIAFSRADIVIFSGGLGPTEDDVTREAVAEALGLSIKRSADLLAQLHARFATRRMTMPENNARQADVIDGAEILPNAKGTAPGQWIDTVYEGHRKLVLLLPGPPSEIKPMFDEQCVPRLKAELPERYIARRTLRLAMIPESQADARSAPIYKEYLDVDTTILAHFGEIQFHFLSEHTSMEAAQARVDELAGKIEEELEEFLYSSQGESLEEIVLLLLDMRGLTLSVAESCTGGMLSQRLTSVSGSSRSFLGGAVVYSNELKTAFADVPPELIEQHGAVSRQVAKALAEGIRKRTGSTLGIGITGIAGPTGGTPEKPVGLVYIGLTDGKDTVVQEIRTSGDRERIRFYASQQALDMLRRKLQV
ncbi:MAG: competence/damage-inducible protein A [Acidobacteriaceae bacterium]